MMNLECSYDFIKKLCGWLFICKWEMEVIMKNQHFKIFQTAFLQVFLISINTIFLSKGIYIGVAIAGFLISYLWVSNVKKANIATKKDQIIYSLGAMTGGLSGLFITSLIL